MIRKIFTLICCLAFAATFAQKTVYENTNYSPKVKTVLLQKDLSIYDPSPVISLNSGDRLKLSFDLFSTNSEFFNYTFVHCNRNWEASDLQQMEYISGNLMGEITSISFSTNTYQKYTHYALNFPTTGMGLTKSGNYILKVFRNFDETDLVL
ncbi:DUF5103 domain-containing protein, partial [Bacteroidia bacterium]|nr:DUF5103 domain-containing protein [Bacteroidia bacterium]